MSRVSGNFPVQIAMRLPDLSAGGLLWCIVQLPVCPRVVSYSKFHQTDKHDLSAARLVSDKSLASRSVLVRHVRLSRDMLATSSRGCYEDDKRKLLPRIAHVTHFFCATVDLEKISPPHAAS